MLDLGCEVTPSVTVCIDIGHGRRPYMPGDIYGCVVDRDRAKGTLTVQWYNHHAQTRLPGDCLQLTSQLNKDL